jgi:hypothetical protein
MTDTQFEFVVLMVSIGFHAALWGLLTLWFLTFLARRLDELETRLVKSMGEMHSKLRIAARTS